MRRILHIDMDAFYASVEQRDNPAIRGKPVVVGGDPAKRGVVAAASYEARRFGVRSAMPMSRAVRLCSALIIVRPDFQKYRAVSEQVFTIYRNVTPLVEPLSLDEAYLDVTENSWQEPLGVEVARRIKQAIKETTGLTASAGVAPNKFLAKIASGWKKPDGLTVIAPERIGGVVVYDISNPFEPELVDYVNTRNFSGSFNFATSGDLGPEGVIFISADDSPNGKPLVVVAHEVSGSTVVYQVNKRAFRREL